MFVVFFGARVAKWGPGPKKLGTQEAVLQNNLTYVCLNLRCFFEADSELFVNALYEALGTDFDRIWMVFGSLWKTFSSTNQQTSILAGKGSGCSENPSHEILGGRF